MNELFRRQLLTLIGTALDSGESEYDIIECVREGIQAWQEIHPDCDEQEVND